jgi:hypothetical protein
VSPWLITTTTWPAFTLRLVSRVLTAPATVALAAAVTALLFGLVVVRLSARGRSGRRSTS